ncbi:MAG: RpiB/LacA/LacB family sugar-phosphate isomerase [Candidatus Taylorbacteria bacterium]|nr:RpiB/LacA/LacB family sugar-phosphate isomerase [Candidatus Taylorbacteria bacterium]
MIYLGSDHRGFALKEKLKTLLTEWGYDYEDMGPFEYSKDDDYPDFAKLVGEKVASDPDSKGILICGSGVGVAMTADKIKGARAGTMFDVEQVKASVADEATNVIGLSNDYTSEEKNIQIAKAFLESKFSGLERHVRRVNKIKNLEK